MILVTVTVTMTTDKKKIPIKYCIISDLKVNVLMLLKYLKFQ